MRVEELKRGLWGYQKQSIFQYIAEQEEAFSRKLLEKDQQAEAAAQLARERIQALEAEVTALRGQLGELQRRHAHIADTLLDARAAAEEMKAESRAQEEAAREVVRKTLDGAMGEVAGYRERIAGLRRAIERTLRDMDSQTAQLEEEAEALEASSPANYLNFFQEGAGEDA